MACLLLPRQGWLWHNTRPPSSRLQVCRFRYNVVRKSSSCSKRFSSIKNAPSTNLSNMCGGEGCILQLVTHWKRIFHESSLVHILHLFMMFPNLCICLGFFVVDSQWKRTTLEETDRASSSCKKQLSNTEIGAFGQLVQNFEIRRPLKSYKCFRRGSIYRRSKFPERIVSPIDRNIVWDV